MEISNFHLDNIRVLLKLKDRFLYFKGFCLCLIMIVLVISLFYFKIPMRLELEGIVKCNKKECTYTVVATSNLQKYSNNLKEITFNETYKINKIVFEEPYVLNNSLVSNMVIYVDSKELKNNQVVKGTLTLKEDTVISLFLKSLKGGDEDA